MGVLDPRALHRPTLTGHAKRTTHLRGFLLGRNYYMAAEAMDFASSFHTGTRKDGSTPEFAHQVYIVSYLTTLLPHLRHPEETLAVGFLHDVCEDYPVSFEEIDRLFGERVGEAIRPLTKKYQGFKRDAHEVIIAQQGNPISSVVKGVDRFNNQQTSPGVFSQTKILSYLDETRGDIIPMLKVARRRFPDQDLAYQNVKTVLFAQIELLEAALAGLVLRAPEVDKREEAEGGT